jgi:hypothetical protein
MELRIDAVKNIAYIKLSGPVTKDDILGAFDQAVTSDQYRDGMGRLWDFTEIDLSTLDSKFIPEMAAYSRKFPPGMNDVKVSFVVTKAMHYGLTRMFQIYSDMSAKTQIMIFQTIEEAEKWMTG